MFPLARAIHGKAATPKIKTWADIVKKPVGEKRSPVQSKPVSNKTVKPPTPRPVVKVRTHMGVLFVHDL